MTEQTWIGILYLTLGFGLVGLCFPLLAGRVSRNRWYGFRFPKAYQSAENWLLINRYGARQMIRWASALAGLGAFLIIAQDGSEAIVGWISVGAPFLLLVPILLTFWYSTRLP